MEGLAKSLMRMRSVVQVHVGPLPKSLSGTQGAEPITRLDLGRLVLPTLAHRQSYQHEYGHQESKQVIAETLHCHGDEGRAKGHEQLDTGAAITPGDNVRSHRIVRASGSR